MSRTADRLIAEQWSFPLGIDENRDFMVATASAVRTSPVIVADNVAHYVDGRRLCLQDYPSLAPPWPSAWIEYPSSSGRQRRGVWMLDSTENADDEPTDHLRALSSGAKNDALIANGVDPADVRWITTFVLFVEQDDRVWGPAGMFSLALDRSGQVIGNRWSVAPVLDAVSTVRESVDDVRSTRDTRHEDDALALPTLAEMEAMSPEAREVVYEMAVAMKAKAEEQLAHIEGDIERIEAAAQTFESIIETGFPDTDDEQHIWLWRALAPAMQAVAFLHCKNVVLDEIVPPSKVQHKRRSRGKPQLVRYHTLRLDVPRRQSESAGGRGFGASALHIVAGHFSHYGDCCPGQHEPHGMLFGRLSGVYWMPSHIRGDRSRGEVRTDFDLQVPAVDLFDSVTDLS